MTMILQVTRSLEALTQRRAFGRWKDIVQRFKGDGSTISREATVSFYETATGRDRESLLISRIDRLDESQRIVVDAVAKLEERSATLFTTIMDKMEDLSRRLKSRGDDEERGTLSSMQLERRELAQPRILTESVGATPNPSETGSATSPLEVERVGIIQPTPRTAKRTQPGTPNWNITKWAIAINNTGKQMV